MYHLMMNNRDFSSTTSMKNFSSNSSTLSNSRKSMGDRTIMSNSGASLLEDPSQTETTTLSDKLKLDPYELSQFDPIPAQILRKVPV